MSFSRISIKHLVISIILCFVGGCTTLQAESLSSRELESLHEWNKVYYPYFVSVGGYSGTEKQLFEFFDGAPVEYIKRRNNQMIVGFALGAYSNCDKQTAFRLVEVNLTDEKWRIKEIGVREWTSYEDLSHSYILSQTGCSGR